MVLRGWQDPTNNLWRVLLISTGGRNIEATADIMQEGKLPPTYVTNNMYDCQGTTPLIILYYLTLFYPAISTWIKAINAVFFWGWPWIISKLVTTYIKLSEESTKGRKNQQQQGLRFSKNTKRLHTIDNNMDAISQ